MLDEPIQIVPYDAAWPAAYAAEAVRITGALTSGPAIELAHFGSTAVRGLSAKPIVDILIGLSEADADPQRAAVSAALCGLGYEALGEAGVRGRLYFRKRSMAMPHYNAAVVARASTLWTDNLDVRDYLCAHPDEARRYADHKRAIIAAGATKLLAYSAAKAAHMQRLVPAARAYAQRAISQ